MTVPRAAAGHTSESVLIRRAAVRMGLQAAAFVTVVVIAARFIWVYPATYIPRWISPGLRRRDPSPPWQTPFLLGFTGVRGIVSLAAALGIPFVTASGAPFPDRKSVV